MTDTKETTEEELPYVALSERLIQVNLKGRSPLMLDAMPVSFSAAEDGESGGKPGKPRSAIGGEEDSPRAQAEQRLYWDNKKRLMLPPGAVYKAIIEAGRLHKLGKRQVTTRDTSLVSGGMWVEEPYELLLTDKEPPWEVDTRPVTNKNTGNKIICHRPLFHDWRTQLTLRVDTSLFTVNLAHKIVSDAGARIGIGVMRPEKKGSYGRFYITRWEEIDE